MTLRSKLMLFIAAFVTTSVTLSLGAVYIFMGLNSSLEHLDIHVKGDVTHMHLKTSVSDFLGAINSYSLTGDIKYRGLYLKRLEDVRMAFDELDAHDVKGLNVQDAQEEFQKIKRLADEIITTPDPASNPSAFAAMRKIEELRPALISKIDYIRDESLKPTIGVLESAKAVRESLTVYFILLGSFSVIATVFLAVFMGRFLGRPFRELVYATGKVSAGDLGYRINSTRKDEFGVIARGFDEMVRGLEESSATVKEKLLGTELLMKVSQIAGTTPDLAEAMRLIVGTIADMTGRDFCAVYLYRAELGAFALEASNVETPSGSAHIPLGSELSKYLTETLKPVIVEDTADYPGSESICPACRSLLAAPVIRDSSCTGLLMLGEHRSGGFKSEELDTVMILAHTVGAVIRNAELYAATGEQLKQLGIVYKLSNTLASLFEPDEILRTITAEIAKLINAKGCIIRLIEDGRLNVKSFYGFPDDIIEDMSLPEGKGIAGWVAKEGKPLLVEDIRDMPEEMRIPKLSVRSAICVPLKEGERVIGTLGLYDKLGPGGKDVFFTSEDLAVAEGFASISAVALVKARMQEEKYEKEAEMLEAKKRMDLLFESVQGGIITMDRNFIISSANKYIERWTDKSLKEIIGKSAISIFHEKGGICPHCATKATFETGSINTINQSRGLNYAELASYPLRDESGKVVEAVVFILDITDRVLYQEEIMGLYREVAQTKDSLESLIDNSADAIVTSDIDGLITSWNRAAEKVYGYTAEEVIGKFLPFVPDSLMDSEMKNIVRIKDGEVIRNLEALRITSDGRMIEVSLTLSPIKDAAGEIVGISGISRDITERKRVEKELIRRNQELSRLFFISSAMRGTLELDRILRMVLTAVTMSDGLGFNRAILFLVDEEKHTLKGMMGVGPRDADEASRVWSDLSASQASLHDVMRDIESNQLSKDSFMDRLSVGIELSLEEDSVLTRAIKEKTPQNVLDVYTDPLSDAVLIQQFGTQAYAVVPLISMDKVVGVIWVDNLFNRRPITEEDIKFLSGFSNQVASAIENARLFEKVSLAEAELENIFSSISDMVYFTDKEYTVGKANQAVVDRLGLPMEQIVGQKCYKVFHGTDSPLPECPHCLTLETLTDNIEEFDDPHMDGTFLASTSPIFDPGGEFIGTVHVVRDITEMKELSERLKSSEKMAALGEVAARVAHEIRNPLVSVGGFASRLEGKLDGKLKEYASIISQEVGHLEDILRDILGFVREARLMKKEVDLSELVEGILTLMKPEIKGRNNSVVKELDPLNVTIDPERMKEALVNILVNANQATENGTLTVKVFGNGAEAIVEVADTGTGIDDEVVKRIFDPFYTTRPTGTGLGLAIAKRIVEEHKGRITVRSKKPGEGTVFRIYLPEKGG